MAFSIFAKDNEFGTATGSNVNVAPGQSRFDYPPNSTQDLVITTKDGDPDPRLFELGDTYDVSWNGSGGGGTILDAVVVRSDDVGSGGAIVFEGTDETGNLAQVIWSPDVDLEAWYWSNYNGSEEDGAPEPRFYTTDQNAAYTHEYICFERTVPIHTPRGLVPAGRIAVGDTVCTWEGGVQTVRWVGCKTVPGDGRAAPVRFARGAIGNFQPIKLSPQHRVLIASPRAELMFGVSEVLVPAIALVDGQSVRVAPRARVAYVHLLLDRHSVLIAAGAPCESLLPGYRTTEFLSAEDRAAVRSALGDGPRDPCRLLLSRSEARALARDRAVPRRDRAAL